MRKVVDGPERKNVKCGGSHSVVGPHVRENNVIPCVGEPQMEGMRSATQTATRNRLTAPTEALCHIQFFNFCHSYIPENVKEIQNRA